MILWKLEIVCNIMNVITATFNQCNASFINKNINKNKKILLTPNFFKGSVHLPM